MNVEESILAGVSHARCNDEQVHRIGRIQPYGVLLALSEPDLTVQHASVNTTSIFDLPVSAVVGNSLENVVGRARFAAFQEAFSVRPNEPFGRIAATLSVNGADVEFDCIYHRQDGLLIAEFEPRMGAHTLGAIDIDTHLRLPLAHMEAASGISELAQCAAQEIGSISRFDRVMVYRFDEEWHGEVIAEFSRTGEIAYFGHRFPAGDIPPQVRPLFLVNPMRSIADAEAQAVPIVPERCSSTGQPLDLTFSVLRSAAPIHLEYLKNMGVAASMTVSIVVEGKLWGLIAAHHTAPHRVDRSARSICELIGRTLASQVALRLDNRALQMRLQSRKSIERCMANMREARTLQHSIDLQSGQLIELFDAAGLVACVNGQISHYGAAVDPRHVGVVAKHLHTQASAGVASSSDLTDALEESNIFSSPLCGALYISLSPNGGWYLLFLLEELVRTVIWAGDPNKTFTVDPSGKLHPRASFAAWSQTVRGQSRKWTSIELERASILREQLLRLEDQQRLSLANDSLNKEIAERKKTEQALREAERRYRGIFDEAIAGLFQSSPDGKLLNVNPAMAELFGYSSPSEMIAVMQDGLWQACVSEEQRETVLSRLSTQGRLKNFECEVYRKDGERIWISCNLHAVQQGTVTLRHEGMVIEVPERSMPVRHEMPMRSPLPPAALQAAGVARSINLATRSIDESVRSLQASFEEFGDLMHILRQTTPREIDGKRDGKPSFFLSGPDVGTA